MTSMFVFAMESLRVSADLAGLLGQHLSLISPLPLWPFTATEAELAFVSLPGV